MANGRGTVAETAARQLANATKTRAQWGRITPRWLIPFLPWTPVEAGIFRLNRVKQTRGATGISADDVESSPPRDEDPDLPETFVDYEEHPREYFLSAITTVLDVQTRVSDLYSRPFDQIQEQLRILIEKVKETHESELINNPEYGLLASVAPSMTLPTRGGAPTPDDLDELISRVWKEPAFFLAHPAAIAAFGRECTRRGVPPPTVNLFGSPFLTWRGLPLVPSDKVPVERGTSKILLLRTGEKKQGVVGLFQPGVPGEVSPSLSVRFMGINRKAIASYLVSLYSSLAVLTEDALGVLENVEVGKYHQYDHTYVKGGAAATASRPRTARKRS
jgi:Phage capsid-like protein